MSPWCWLIASSNGFGWPSEPSGLSMFHVEVKIGITPKSDKITMKDSDELYANIPVYAAKFEGKLQKSGALNVAMTQRGSSEAPSAMLRFVPILFWGVTVVNEPSSRCGAPFASTATPFQV